MDRHIYFGLNIVIEGVITNIYPYIVLTIYTSHTQAWIQIINYYFNFRSSLPNPFVTPKLQTSILGFRWRKTEKLIRCGFLWAFITLIASNYDRKSYATNMHMYLYWWYRFWRIKENNSFLVLLDFTILRKKSFAQPILGVGTTPHPHPP
jgi:hypothetical protein